MRDINDASLKVVDISNVIDEIAFQTKLLALNAAVEAARAGLQGRSFAVVASEVQNLAKRSAEAAKEIKTLVVDNMEKINTGSEYVHQTDQALTEILHESDTINQLVSEISSAIQEEYIGINQINQVVLNIQSIAEENSEAVSFIMTLSEEANQQAESLGQLMSFFNTGEQKIGPPGDEQTDFGQLNSVEAPTALETTAKGEVDQDQDDDFFI